MFAKLDNDSGEIKTFATWEEFAPTILMYYQCGTKTETYSHYDGSEANSVLPVYTKSSLLSTPHPYVKISSNQHLQIIELVRKLFETHHIIIVSNPNKLFHGNNLNLSRLFNCVDDNQRISLLKEFRQGIKRSNHLVGIMHFMIQHLADGDNILSGLYESFMAKQPHDKGTLLLKNINRQLNITNILNELE